MKTQTLDIQAVAREALTASIGVGAAPVAAVNMHILKQKITVALTSSGWARAEDDTVSRVFRAAQGLAAADGITIG